MLGFALTQLGKRGAKRGAKERNKLLDVHACARRVRGGPKNRGGAVDLDITAVLRRKPTGARAAPTFEKNKPMDLIPEANAHELGHRHRADQADVCQESGIDL